MFNLIALLFLITNGITSEKPSGALRANVAFTSEEDCKKYLEAAPGKELKAALLASLKAHHQKMAVKFSCVEIEDNTI